MSDPLEIPIDKWAKYEALPIERRFACFFNFLGWWHWSLGVHLDVRHPHLFIHVPLGYVCVGWMRSPTIDHPRWFGWDGWKDRINGR